MWTSILDTCLDRVGTGFKPGFLPEPQWRDENFSALAFRALGPNNLPTPVKIPTTTGLYLANFTNAAGVTEVLASGLELQHDWKIGTNIKPHVHIIKTSSGTGDVKFSFEYQIRYNGSILSDTISNTYTVDALTSFGSSAYIALGEIDLSSLSGNTEAGAQVTFRIYRDPADAADTFAGDVGVTTFGWHYQVDTNGSRTERYK